MKFQVTQREEIEAETPEAAAVEFDRLQSTTRPKELTVTQSGVRQSVFMRVERGQAKRIA